MTLGLYTHIPFCRGKCSYCHFISFQFNPSLAARYHNAVLKEIESADLAGGRFEEVDTIYFGGGTPTLIPDTHIRDVLDEFRRKFRIKNDCEISIEANPGTLSKRKIAALRTHGVNRISLGAQSFDDQELASIGRLHTRDMIFAVLNQLKLCGFQNVNLDLMLGLPYQTDKSWKLNLEILVQLEIPHISIYMLDLDDNCPLSNVVASGSVPLPEEDLIADMYLDAVHLLSSKGYKQYEISNFAQPGYACQHNLKYWRRQPVLGFGLASHSFDGSARFANQSDMNAYLAAAENGYSPVLWREEIGLTQEFQETIFLGLRLTEGLDCDQLKTRYGEDAVSALVRNLQDLSAQGFVRIEGGRILLTPSAMLVSNEIFQQFV